MLLLDPSAHFLVATAARGLEEEVSQGVRIPLGVGFAGRIAAERRPVVIDQVDHLNVLNPILRDKGIHSLLNRRDTHLGRQPPRLRPARSSGGMCSLERGATACTAEMSGSGGVYGAHWALTAEDPGLSASARYIAMGGVLPGGSAAHRSEWWLAAGPPESRRLSAQLVAPIPSPHTAWVAWSGNEPPRHRAVGSTRTDQTPAPRRTRCLLY